METREEGEIIRKGQFKITEWKFRDWMEDKIKRMEIKIKIIFEWEIETRQIESEIEIE